MIDTNIFYNFLFETNLTDEAVEILEIDEPLFTSFTVVNEMLYITSRKIAERKFDIHSSRKFKRIVCEKGYDPFIGELTKFLDLLDDLHITVLRDHRNDRYNEKIQFSPQ